VWANYPRPVACATASLRPLPYAPAPMAVGCFVSSGRSLDAAVERVRRGLAAVGAPSDARDGVRRYLDAGATSPSPQATIPV
jgi:hypothetical protein